MIKFYSRTQPINYNQLKIAPSLTPQNIVIKFYSRTQPTNWVYFNQ